MRVKAFVVSKYLGAVAIAAAVSAEQRKPMRLAIILAALTLVVGAWEWWRDRASISRARRSIRAELDLFLSDGPHSERLIQWLSIRGEAPLGEDAEKFMRVLQRRNRFGDLLKTAEEADLPTRHLRDCDDAVEELSRFADAWNTGGLAKLPSSVALQEYRQRVNDLASSARSALDEVGE